MAVKSFPFVYKALEGKYTPNKIEKSVQRWQEQKRSADPKTIVAFCEQVCKELAEVEARAEMPALAPTKTVEAPKPFKRLSERLHAIQPQRTAKQWKEFLRTRPCCLVEGMGVLPACDRTETEGTQALRRAELFAPRPQANITEVYYEQTKR